MYNRRSSSILVSITISLCVIALAGDSLHAQKWGKVTDEEWNLLPPANYPEAGAVVIFDNGEQEITTSQISLARHVRMKVFDKSRADEVSSVEIYYRDGDKIKLLDAHTILPNGEKKKIKEKFKKEVGGFKVITFAFPNVEDGAILEYRYTQVHQRYSFLDPWYFQHDAYTLHSQFSVDLAPGFTYRTTFVNVPVWDQKPEEEISTYTWSVDSLPPLRDEPYMGAERSYMTSINLQLLSFKDQYNDIEFGLNWGQLGEFISEDADDFGHDKNLIHDVAQTITGDKTTLEDKIISLYEFVRDSIETRSDINYSFFDKDQAEELMEHRHGTAVEKNTLLVDLLRSLDVEAYPLMIGTRDFSAFNPNVHELRQFNHIICCLMCDSSRAATLDARDRSVAYPYLPPRDLVSGGLLLNGDKSAPVKLTHASRTSGAQLTSTVSLHPDGSAVCTTSVCVVGYEMNKFESVMRDTLSQKELMDEVMNSDDTKSEVLSAKVNHDVESDSLHFEFVFTLPEFATILDNNVFIKSSVIPMWNPFTDDRRFCPVDFRYPFFRHCSTTINLPEGMKVAEAPPDVEKRMNGGMYVRRSFWSDRSITVSAMLKIDEAVFTPREYPQLKRLFDAWEDAGTDQVAAVSDEQTEN